MVNSEGRPLVNSERKLLVNSERRPPVKTTSKLGPCALKTVKILIPIITIFALSLAGILVYYLWYKDRDTGSSDTVPSTSVIPFVPDIPAKTTVFTLTSSVTR